MQILDEKAKETERCNWNRARLEEVYQWFFRPPRECRSAAFEVPANSKQTNDLLNAEDLSSLLDNAADMGNASDGTMDREQHHPDGPMASPDQCQRLEQPNAYISVSDPFGEAAFKPSKFKPLPSWMNLLANNVHRERGQKRKAILEDDSQYLSELGSSRTKRESCSSGSSGDSRASPIVLVDVPNLGGGGKVTFPISDHGKSRKQRERRAISFNPKNVADDTKGNEGHRCPRTLQAAGPVHTADSEYPSYHPPPPRRTHYPHSFSRIPAHRKDACAYAPKSSNLDIAEETTGGPCCELAFIYIRERVFRKTHYCTERERAGDL